MANVLRVSKIMKKQNEDMFEDYENLRAYWKNMVWIHLIEGSKQYHTKREKIIEKTKLYIFYIRVLSIVFFFFPFFF